MGAAPLELDQELLAALERPVTREELAIARRAFDAEHLEWTRLPRHLATSEGAALEQALQAASKTLTDFASRKALVTHKEMADALARVTEARHALLECELLELVHQVVPLRRG